MTDGRTTSNRAATVVLVVFLVVMGAVALGCFSAVVWAVLG